jgi:hypothetical protein
MKAIKKAMIKILLSAVCSMPLLFACSAGKEAANQLAVPADLFGYLGTAGGPAWKDAGKAAAAGKW